MKVDKVAPVMSPELQVVINLQSEVFAQHEALAGSRLRSLTEAGFLAPIAEALAANLLIDLTKTVINATNTP